MGLMDILGGGSTPKKETLTAKRVCGVCGAKINALAAVYTRAELRDNCYICAACEAKCSPNLAYSVISSWTVEDVRRHMAYVASMPKLIAAYFQASDGVAGTNPEEGPLLLGDTARGLWYAASKPELFRFDQVEGWRLWLRTDDESSGIHSRIEPPRPDMPALGRTEKLEGMELEIALKDHPYAEKVMVPICGGNSKMFGSYKGYVQGAYDCALRCYEFFERNRAGSSAGQLELF